MASHASTAVETPPATAAPAVFQESDASASAAVETTEITPALVDVPLRFINAEKGDVEKARARYLVTLEWRKTEDIDNVLSKPAPAYRTIKQHYPHFYHKRGKNGEPVYYEKPGRIDFKAARATGLSIPDLLNNFVMITEFLWQVIEPDDNKKCISVLDLAGFGLSDCFGEPMDYVRKCSALSGQHYPERCAYIIAINAPSWCSMVWSAVKPLIDEVTRQKIIIVRGGSKKILEALSDKIPIENIPQEYGGTSVGRSPEEELLDRLIAFNNHEEGAPETNPLASRQ